MVSRDTRETALLVAAGVLGFVTMRSLGGPEVLAGLVLVAFAVVGPVARDEWRRRQDT